MCCWKARPDADQRFFLRTRHAPDKEARQKNLVAVALCQHEHGPSHLIEIFSRPRGFHRLSRWHESSRAPILFWGNIGLFQECIGFVLARNFWKSPPLRCIRLQSTRVCCREGIHSIWGAAAGRHSDPCLLYRGHSLHLLHGGLERHLFWRGRKAVGLFKVAGLGLRVAGLGLGWRA